MKMVMIAYNEAIDDEVMEILERCELKNYTKIAGVFGRGAASGTHLGNDVWPGRNNLLYIACGEKEAEQLFSLRFFHFLPATVGVFGVFFPKLEIKSS